MFVCFFLNVNVIFLFISSARGDTVSTSTSILLANSLILCLCRKRLECQCPWLTMNICLFFCVGTTTPVYDYVDVLPVRQFCLFFSRSSFWLNFSVGLKKNWIVLSHPLCLRMHPIFRWNDVFQNASFLPFFFSFFYFSFFVEHLWINGTFILAPRQIICILDSDAVCTSKRKNEQRIKQQNQIHFMDLMRA